MRGAMLAVGVLVLALAPARAVDKTVIDRAVDRGVAALKAMQQADGTWPSNAPGELGSTALAALALLECDVPKTDRSIVAAARAVREAGFTETKTYSVALSILFLDKLDEPADTPLIESLIVRLIAGQRADGGWSYNCPGPAAQEVRRLRTGRDLSRMPDKGKRNKDDLPKEIRDQLVAVERLGALAADPRAIATSDNSNTQFATLGLWVGRRYGVPTQGTLLKAAQRFRLSQNADGGWGYNSGVGATTSSAAMTCAALFALAAGHGAAFDAKKAKDPKLEKEDVGKDAPLNTGLAALATVVGSPVGWNGAGPRHPAVTGASGKAFYYLWSLERVAVVLNLDTIGKKDWYAWGAEILVANQEADGHWRGEYYTYGADTAFALLFLKKANLARDLSGVLRTPRSDPRVLRGGSSLRSPRDLTAAGLGDKAKGGQGDPPSAIRATVERPRPAASTSEEKAVVNLGDQLVKAAEADRAGLLKQLRDSKGAVNTETLVWAISRLEGDGRRQARVALAERFTRLKDTTLREYLKDDEPEIRRAAALAAAARGSKVLVPDLIRGLNDPEDVVRRAAYTALKELTKKDLGPAPAADEARRKAALADWERWWKETSRE
ncbi:MAG: HEAT repeat domain-containing protein [Gemmataceae bacterium]